MLVDVPTASGRKPAGDPDEVVILERPGRGRREPPVWLALPKSARRGAEPLGAVDGFLRGAAELARLVADRAAAFGRPVIAPLFTHRHHPRYQRAVSTSRPDLALLALLDSLATEEGLATRKFALFGYSGGAQFAHRFAWLYPHRVSRLSVAAAGWYTFPDNAPFPYGLGASNKPRPDFGASCRANLRDFLGLPIDVIVGGRDDVVDENTRSGPAIDGQQGVDRLTRAQRWTAALRASAADEDVTARVALHVLDGCRHDFRECISRGRLDAIVLPQSSDGQARLSAASRNHFPQSEVDHV